MYRLLILVVFVFAACNNESKLPKNTSDKIHAKDTTIPEVNKEKYADIQFASKRDTTCGMPISAGITDTLVLKEKVYGFCAAECKAEFVTILKKQHKR